MCTCMKVITHLILMLLRFDVDFKAKKEVKFLKVVQISKHENSMNKK